MGDSKAVDYVAEVKKLLAGGADAAAAPAAPAAPVNTFSLDEDF